MRAASWRTICSASRSNIWRLSRARLSIATNGRGGSLGARRGRGRCRTRPGSRRASRVAPPLRIPSSGTLAFAAGASSAATSPRERGTGHPLQMGCTHKTAQATRTHGRDPPERLGPPPEGRPREAYMQQTRSAKVSDVTNSSTGRGGALEPTVARSVRLRRASDPELVEPVQRPAPYFLVSRRIAASATFLCAGPPQSRSARAR